MLAELVGAINAAHGTAFAPGERYSAGEQGAYALVAGDGRAPERFVLKWKRGTELPPGLAAATAVTDRLRAIGYPAPRIGYAGVAPALGVAYWIQEALPGAPLGGRLDDATLSQVLVLNGLQRGRAAASARDWPSCLGQLLLHGGDGFCLLEPMRSYSTATAELLAALQRTADTHAGEASPATDVVHYDFHGANILVEGDRVTGVVDWGGARAGDCAFDLATFFFYHGSHRGAVDPVALERLWQEVRARSTPGLRRLYLAHIIHRQVDWAIRFPRGDLVEWSMGRASAVMGRLASDG